MLTKKLNVVLRPSDNVGHWGIGAFQGCEIPRVPNSDHGFTCQQQSDADPGTLLASLQTGAHHLQLLPSIRGSACRRSVSSLSLSLLAHMLK